MAPLSNLRFGAFADVAPAEPVPAPKASSTLPYVWTNPPVPVQVKLVAFTMIRPYAPPPPAAVKLISEVPNIIERILLLL